MESPYVNLSKEDRQLLCKKGEDEIQVKYPKKNIQPNDQEVEDFKEYLLQTRKRGPVKLLSAFKCPMEPAVYIYVLDYYEFVDNMYLWVIFKEEYDLSKQKPVTAYEIRVVKDITEGDLEDLTYKSELRTFLFLIFLYFSQLPHMI
mgnify:CR=1 FL=1